jgi:hypothetical protein
VVVLSKSAPLYVPLNPRVKPAVEKKHERENTSKMNNHNPTPFFETVLLNVQHKWLLFGKGYSSLLCS